MKLHITQPNLMAALSQAKATAPSKSPIPAMTHALLNATDVLTISATDMDTELTTRVNADVTDAGMTCAPIERMLAVVSKLGKTAIIEMYTEDGRLHIKSGRAHVDLATLDPDDFPHVSSSDYDDTFTVESHVLQDMFGKVKFSVSTEEARYYLNGVYMHHDSGRVHTIATDGHRFAKWSFESDATPCGVIVPSKTVGLLTPPDGSTVNISTSVSKIKFEADGWCLVSKVIDGVYPDYTRIIPSSKATVATFGPSDMVRAGAVTQAIADSRSSAVVMGVSVDGISVQGTSGVGSAEDYVDADVTGDDVRVGVNGKYLAEIMSQLDGNAIMHLGGAMDPVKLLDDNDPDWLGIVMPMRV